MTPAEARRIAQAFAPPSRLGNQWHYWYVRSKLGSDPLFDGVIDALHGTRDPVLDLGCGLGLLAHCLRGAGIALDYAGVDVDASKIVRARHAAQRAGLAGVRFDTLDLARAMPAHRGSVAVLDVLQYVPEAAQRSIIDAAVGMLTPQARLVIRTGLDDGSHRARLTHAADVIGRVSGWMHSRPRTYPRRDALQAQLEAAGLVADFMPWHGNTPFNNWRIVARHA